MNLGKSSLIGVGQVPNIDVLAADLECQVGDLPTQYLGLPLGAHYKCKETWDPVIDRIRRKLAGWKAHYLSKGGKLTLIKAALASILVYYMSLSVIPKQVADHIEKL